MAALIFFFFQRYYLNKVTSRVPGEGSSTESDSLSNEAAAGIFAEGGWSDVCTQACVLHHRTVNEDSDAAVWCQGAFSDLFTVWKYNQSSASQVNPPCPVSPCRSIRHSLILSHLLPRPSSSSVRAPQTLQCIWSLNLIVKQPFTKMPKYLG